jgi:uncharacterized membrane protein YoaK (UPF0700 family)
MKLSMPTLLSINGGYVDTAGYLALHGLFTTHVTGNFVTLGAALVLGTSGVVAKLLALPMFCVVVVSTRLLSVALEPTIGAAGPRISPLRTLLGIKVALLILGAALAIGLGPFDSGDGWSALLTGMTLVAAMAIQNAIHRIHMNAAPPTTIMTGNTTQIMIDLADLLRGVSPNARGAIFTRLSRMSGSVAAFAAGCAAAALIYAKQGVWCFAIPPIVAACTLWLRE